MHRDIRARFGERVKRLRKKRGWTQVDLADRLGLARSYLVDIEAGNRNVSLLNIEVIANGFGLSVARLMSGL
jgi:transcriptional regulator with XRE-family HTH domain